MKVFNLTDVETPVLLQRGLVDQGIGISRRMVAPGEYVEVEDTAETRAKLEYLLTVGAVSIDQMPPSYALARNAKQSTASNTGHLAAITTKHVAVNETKVAGEPAPSPAVPAGDTVALERHASVDELADIEQTDTRKGQDKKRR